MTAELACALHCSFLQESVVRAGLGVLGRTGRGGHLEGVLQAAAPESLGLGEQPGQPAIALSCMGLHLDETLTKP